MDERVVEDVMPVSEPQEPQDVVSQGKRSRGCVLEQQVRVIPREGAQPRSSIQEFVDIFHGRDPNNTVNIVGTSSNHGGNSGGRVEELTLGHYDSRCSMLNQNEMMETLLDERKHENHPGDGIEPRSSHRYATSHQDFPTTSVVLENLKTTDILARQSSDQNSNLLGQSSYNSNGIVLGNELSSGGMRTKILSKSSSSGFSEYFVKSTLKGKGIIYQRGLTGADADAGSGTVAGAGSGTAAGAGAGIDAGTGFHAGTKIRGQNSVEDSVSHTTCNQLVNVRKKYMVHSANDMAGFNLGTSGESVSNGVSLREFLESGKGNLLKVDCMFVFKQILDLVCFLHSQGKILVDLRPSCFKLLPSKKVMFCGRISISTEVKKLKQNEAQKLQALKRPSELGRSRNCEGGAKHLKLSDNMNFHVMNSRFQLGSRLKPITISDGANLASPGLDCSSLSDSNTPGISSSFPPPTSTRQHAFSSVDQLEAKWYRSPEEVSGSTCSYSSNVYCLGVFLFELLSSFQSGEGRDAAMSDLHLRILPPNFLSENPMEAGFCLWLLHPKPSLRPKARDILHSEIISGYHSCVDDKSSSTLREDEDVTELLLQFLLSIKEQKEKHASKLVAELEYIQADIQEMEERHLLRKNRGLEELQYATERGFLHTGDGLFDPAFHRRDSRFFKNVSQLGNAYFSARSQAQARGSDSLIRPDSDVLKTRENWYSDQQVDEKPVGSIEEVFDGLCKYARYSKLEVCGKIRNRDLSCSNNVICALCFDRDEDYFVAAGVSKKIRIFDFHAVCDSSIDVHYPMVEMSNKSKLSSVCWNKYIRNYMASTDYDGVVKLWDASTGEEFLEYKEHLRRAWCVDFSNLDPKKLASGSDDCSVKLWSINERNCVHNIQNVANVCSVQFSAHSSHLLAFGSADYKICCYDLRNTASPWCILSGHDKSVSYVKFVDSDTIVSASTDNTLKLWDLNRSTDDGLSDNACKLTLSGHTNEKNFVGMSVSNGFIACGSETNEVFTYYKTIPVPITSLKFGTIDSLTGEETDYNHGQFVSSVCWKENSDMLVAANSGGCIKVLRMA